MSEKKKNFAEFLANDALNPGVKNEKLLKVGVGERKTAGERDFEGDKGSMRMVTPKIKKAPVALFGILCLAFLGLTIGLSFVSLWALFGIIPTLICFWKMVLNNADNNYKSVYSKFDGKYIDKEFEKIQKVEEIESDLMKAEAKDRMTDLTAPEDEEQDIKEKKWRKKPKGKKRGKSKGEEDEEVDDFDEDGEEEEEEEEEKEKGNEEYKKTSKAEKSGKKYGSKVEGNSEKKDVENKKSKTSLKERNKGMRFGQSM